VCRLLQELCVQDLSNVYLDVAKDRLYCTAVDDPQRRAAQTVMYQALRVLLLLYAPILPHTAEEAWQAMPHLPADPPSVHLALWPDLPTAWRDDDLARQWQCLLGLRAQVSAAVEQAIAGGVIEKAAEADVTVWGPQAEQALLEPVWSLLADQFLVAGVQWGGAADRWRVQAQHTAQTRCPRCWRYRPMGDARGLCARCATVVAAIDR